MEAGNKIKTHKPTKAPKVKKTKAPKVHKTKAPKVHKTKHPKPCKGKHCGTAAPTAAPTTGFTLETYATVGGAQFTVPSGKKCVHFEDQSIRKSKLACV